MENHAATLPWRSIKVLGLLAAGHFCSHFYYMVLPPLFLQLREVYGVGFTDLGFAMMIFSITNALTAAPVGVLVDRYGAPNILITGLAVEGIVFMLIPLFPNFSALLVLMAIGGVCNSVFHPADYTIIDAAIPKSRMGRAFSVHSFGGYLGGAFGPITVVSLTTWIDWQTAVFLTGAGGVLIAIFIGLNRHLFPHVSRIRAPSKNEETRSGAMQVLFSRPVMFGLIFFAVLSMAEYGIGDFGISSLQFIYEMPLTSATFALSVYLFASPAGVLLGGWLADRFTRHEMVVALCMSTYSGCVMLVAVTTPPWEMLLVLLAIGGFSAGMVAPSRDLIIRSVTPPGDIGKVFGFVAIGLTIGGVISRPLFGFTLDYSDPRMLFALSGLFGLCSCAVALLTARVGNSRRSNTKTPS